MKILSIDPGYDRIGMAILEKDSSKEKIVFSECFQTDKKAETDDRIFAACTEIERLLEKYSPEVFAIENLFFSKNQKTAMAVSQARGAFIQTAKKAKLPVIDLTPLQIKTAVAGHGGASKTEVHKMVSMICKLEDRKYIDDEIDAIAVGISAFSYFKTFNIHKGNK
jgi:crossover junction endodeoxyribonuclease RuvC